MSMYICNVQQIGIKFATNKTCSKTGGSLAAFITVKSETRK